MAVKRESNNAEGNVTWIGVVVLAVLGVLGLYKGFSSLHMYDVYKETWGSFVYNESRTIDDEMEYRAKFRYEVDGKTYYVWTEYDDEWKDAKEQIPVYYNPDNHESAKTGINKTDAWIFLSLGITGIFFAMGSAATMLFDNNRPICELLFGLGFMALGIIFPIMTIKDYGFGMVFMFVIGLAGAVLAWHGLMVLIGKKDKKHELNIFEPLIRMMNKNR
ncbi:MAG: hypothetical protein IJB96_06225 [Lachnospira sp.]|nr:hypothetical protein [Lachnospira sp.]